MTACVKNHSKRVALAISASLVGALTLGAAAPAAFATGIGTQFAEGGIDGSEFAEGDVVAVFTKVSSNSTFIPSANADGVPTITAGSMPFTVTATEVRPAGTDGSHNIQVTPGNDYKVSVYRADEEGKPTGSPLSGNRVYETGEYVLTVTPLTGSDYVGQTFMYNFEVVGEQIAADTYYEGTNTSDQHIVFSGSALDVTYSMDGTALVEGEDYEVSYISQKDGKAYDELVNAGTYSVKLTGLGKYEGTTQDFGTVTVFPYTLDARSTIVVAPFKGLVPTHPDRVYFDDGDATHASDLDTDLVTLAVPTGTDITTAGDYTVNVLVDQDAIAAGNIIYNNATPITTKVVKADEFATFMYNGAALQDSYDIVMSKGQSFNLNAVSAYYGEQNLGTCGSSTYVTCTGSVINNVPGVYKLTFTYNAQGDPVSLPGSSLDGKVIAATKTITVRVWADDIDADTELWVFGPESNTVAINSYAKAYDGNQLGAGSFLVTNQDRTVTNLSGGGLTAKLYDSEGNEVDYAMNAGKYTLRVTSSKYLLTGTTEMPITIGAVDLNSAEVGELKLWNDVAGQEYLEVDGNNATPDYDCSTNANAIKSLGLVFDTGIDGADYDDWKSAAEGDDYAGQDLLPDCVDVVVEFNDNGTWKPVANVNEPGQYRVILTVGDDIASNFEGTEKTIEFTAAKKGFFSFSDVQPSDWCYDAVQNAVANGYMNGYAGTDSFGPWDKLTRGQVAIVLYNMSGASRTWNEGNETNGSYDESKGWVTGFGDVDGHMYYAKAIAWAKSTGVVEGYKDGSGNFGPDDPVTREQFAQMMANYAKVVNRDVTVDQADPASLDEMSDGGQVSGWAQKAVAWAVENDVMGSQGSVMPQDTMDRAMCAQMTVNYQPNAKR